MKTQTKDSTVAISIKTGLRISIPKFVPSENLKFIDKEKMDTLRKGTLALGEYEVEGACSCSTSLTASIENGMVLSIQAEKCKDAKPFPKEFHSHIQQARKRLMKGRNNLKLPMRVSEFLRRGFIDIGGGCITICVFDFCYFCCDLDGTPVCGEPIVVKG